MPGHSRAEWPGPVAPHVLHTRYRRVLFWRCPNCAGAHSVQKFRIGQSFWLVRCESDPQSTNAWPERCNYSHDAVSPQVYAAALLGPPLPGSYNRSLIVPFWIQRAFAFRVFFEHLCSGHAKLLEFRWSELPHALHRFGLHSRAEWPVSPHVLPVHTRYGHEPILWPCPDCVRNVQYVLQPESPVRCDSDPQLAPRLG
jgi:hypothetical protein